MKQTTSFKEYLEGLGHTNQTVSSYLFVIKHFTATNPNCDGYKYKDVLDYLEKESKDYKNSETKGRVLAGIKKYYEYLIDIGVREDHPCRTLYVRANRNRNVIHDDLFSSEELELMFLQKGRYSHLELKRQCIISLLVYQAMTSGEIINLTLKDIDLDVGLINIKGSRKISARKLEFHRKQYRLLDRYIHDERDALLKCKTDKLLIGMRGTPVTQDDVHYTTETCKPLFPDRNLNPKTIRMSVVANWLNEKGLPLEQVQLMAGHKWISTTIRYKCEPPDQQREILNQFHPLA